MKEIDADALIIGSGLVGLVAAHSLSSLNYKVVLIDKQDFLDSNTSYVDTRTVAISEGSKNFLESLFLWKKIERFAEPIQAIKVYNRSSKNKILFKNEIINNKLGYVVENKKLSNVLRSSLLKFKKIKTFYGESVKKINLKDNCSIAYSDNYKTTVKLIVAADGKNSNVRTIVGNKTFKKKYEESALVLNLVHEKKLNGVAYEIFYKTGPLAILPMKSNKQLNCSTVIWSNKDLFFQKLMSSNYKFIVNFLEDKIGDIVGGIIKINSQQKFPLSAHINDSFFNKRLIYIGDSAHSIHPIAGQGWNLGISDVKNLQKISKNLKNKREEFGNISFCKNYNDLSYNKAFQLYQITDKLNFHFKNNNRLSTLTSNLGFKIIENNSFIKNKITKYAMGV